MARPLKQGMDYFPHDCDASEDEKIEALRALYGNDGYAFYFILLERIYRTDNAELDISKKAILAALIKKIGVSEQKFYEILNTAFDIELFSKQIYDESNVITSKGIKKRFGEVESMRKRWRKRKENKEENKGENKEDTSIIFPVENSEETGESKVKKSKVKKSKENNNNKILLSTDEQNFIDTLQTIDNYPLEIEKDVKMFHDLSERYPQLDILQAIKKFAIYKKDKPLTKNSNARTQIDTSFKKYVEWGQCLKEQKEKSKREVWV